MKAILSRHLKKITATIPVKLIRSCFFSLPFLFLQHIYAQNSDKDAIEGYVAFDAVVGIENTNLSQGLLYTEKYRTINEKKQFFKSSDFQKGNIWHSHQPYYDQYMKYDAHHDELIVQLQSQTTGQRAALQLFKIEVDSFDLLEHRFIRLKPVENSPVENAGFYQSLYQNKDLRLFAKHGKNKIERKGDRFVYYEFTDLKKQYILYYKNAFYNLNSKKDFGEALGIDKKELNKLYKRTKRGIKNQDIFMVELVKQIVKVP